MSATQPDDDHNNYIGMNEKNYHRLLKRQLKKIQVDPLTIEQIAPLLDAVNQAYISNDSDVRHLENIIEESSQELFKANQLLSKDLDSKNAELMDMNKRYDLVVNNIREILFVLDNNGIITYINDAWVVLTGVSIEEAIGKKITHFKSQFNESSSRVFDKLVFNGLHEVNGLLEQGSSLSTKKWYELKASRIKNDQGEVEGTIGIVSDITDIKNTETELIRAMQTAERANAAKDEFLSTMSHEIRTPLNSIVGVSNLLLMNNTNPDELDNLQALKFSSDHLLNLINDILDFSKIEAGKIDFENTAFSLRNMLLGIKSTYNYLSEEKGINFKIKKDEDLPESVKGDITRLSQIIGNLVSNAIKFTKEGGVTLDLEVVEENQTHTSIKFEIIDTGIGIMPSKIDKIFEKFSQANSSTTKNYGGTGLGLPICKKLLELQGSELKVESDYGKGSKFYFTINFEKAKSTASQIIKSNIVTNPIFEKLAGFKVLVAEDNRLNIMVIQQFLKKWGTDFEIVKNGQEAVDAVKQNDFDIILMDLQMPVMDGYEATKAIRKLDVSKRDIPILALTASTTIRVKQEAQKVGMNDHIMKPFNPKDLHKTLVYYFHQTRRQAVDA